MKVKLFIASLFLSVIASNTQAALIDVFQGGTFLGSIESYSGTDTAAVNYGLTRGNKWTNDLRSGPTLTPEVGQIFFYEGADGLTFNTIFSSGGDRSERSRVRWNIDVSDSTTDPTVLLSDDRGELVERANRNDSFRANWVFNQYFGDGGIIGEFGGNDWEVEIDPIRYPDNNRFTRLVDLIASDSTGADIRLSINTTENIVFRMSTPVSEPGILALFLIGLLGMSLRKKTA